MDVSQMKETKAAQAKTAMIIIGGLNYWVSRILSKGN